MKVYRPREDTYLLKEYVEDLELDGKKFLEIGTGTGIIAVTAAEKGAEVTATDINPKALEEAAEKADKNDMLNSIDFVESDIFENVEDEFDFIVFNPPYLPGKREKNDPLIGGEEGTEIAEKFLNQCDRYLKENGEAVIVLSSYSETDELESKFELEEVETRELWFEKLHLLIRV